MNHNQGQYPIYLPFPVNSGNDDPTINYGNVGSPPQARQFMPREGTPPPTPSSPQQAIMMSHPPGPLSPVPHGEWNGIESHHPWMSPGQRQGSPLPSPSVTSIVHHHHYASGSNSNPLSPTQQVAAGSSWQPALLDSGFHLRVNQPHLLHRWGRSTSAGGSPSQRSPSPSH